MMNRVITTICCALLVASATFAQDSRPSKGVSKHLLKSFEDKSTLREAKNSLDDIATDVSSALATVDRSKLGKLQDRLGSLADEEEQLKQMLEDINLGLSVPVSVTEKLDASGANVSLDSLQSERELLLGLKSDLERRKRMRAKRRAVAMQREDAKRPTLSTRVLLQALGQLPEVNREAIDAEVTTVAASPFPRKLADALYRTGDYRGALRQYLQAEEKLEKSLELKDRYRMARCYEWLGNTPKALEALEKLTTAQPDETDFWHQRAKSYHSYLSKIPKLDKVLKK